ncbi:ATP-binding protein [Streptomyces sp. NPDC002143]
MTGVTAVPGGLQVPLTTFVGRRHDIAEIRRRLGGARLLTLTGVGGVGKTRLAVEAAIASAEGFADGVWLADLAPVQSPSEVAGAVATALGGLDLGVRPVAERLAGHLAGRRALLVLDNCEHVVDACADLAQALLMAAPDLRILATSRHILGIPGEHLFTVRPLPQDEALELLRDRAAAVEPDFELTDANRPACARLCADLDGLPLAIELAASRLRALTVEEVADRLEDRFGLLTGGSRLGPPRQRTLRAVIDYSYELCSPAERQLWNRLSIFAGSFSLGTAEAVCSGDGIPRRQVVDLLDRLVAQSVVLTDKRGREARYRLLEVIREYGRERLAASGEEQRMLGRHRDFFLAFAQRIDAHWCGPGQVDNLARLGAEHSNLMSALGFRGEPQTTLALAAALRFHWLLGGFLGEGRRRLEQALAAAPESTPARADALCCGAWVALFQGDYTVCDRWLAEAEKLGEELGLPVVNAYAEFLRASLARARGQWAEATSRAEAAVAAHRASGEALGEIMSLVTLAGFQIHLRDPRARETGEQALALAEAHGDRMSQFYALTSLGWDAWARGDRGTGFALIRAGLELAQALNDYMGTARNLQLLAWLSADDGDHGRAARLQGATDALLREVGTDLSALIPEAAQIRARYEETALRVLGPEAYRSALDEGARHDTPARAVDYVLEAGTDTRADAAQSAVPSPLTRREQQVAALVAQGKSNRQIASALALSPRTAEYHVQNILAKLGFGSRSEIASWWTANQVSTP